MGFFNRFKKKKSTEIQPFKKMTREDIEQRRINMQAELDEIDFDTAKSARQARQKRAKSEKRRQTIRDIHRNIDAGLDIFADPTKKEQGFFQRRNENPAVKTNTRRKPRKKTSVPPPRSIRPKSLDDPFGDEIFGGSTPQKGSRRQKRQKDSLLGDTSDFGLL